MNVTGFRQIEQIEDGSNSIIYRAIRHADGKRVVIKTTRSDRPSRAEIQRIHHERAILTHLAGSPFVARPLCIERVDGRLLLTIEDRGGQVLESLMRRPLELADALRYGVAIATALADIHSRAVIHKDVTPRNIVIHDGGASAQLIDFGISTLLPVEHKNAPPPALIEGTLAYISPEQTGRMNRGIDYRTDLYSLGVTLYRMLTGSMPFNGADALEWCHCHLAHPPQPLYALCPDLPPVLSEIVLKLLAKAAEDRYQSANGLAHDLRRCLDEMASCGRIATFALAQADHAHCLLVPEKLYGREQAVATLLECFDEVVADGRCRLVLVAGHSGIGKSSVVHELHKPILAARGNFISGKFDQYKRGIPYATIVQAFQSFVRQLLGGEDDVIAGWRQRIEAAIGTNGRVITDVIPEMEFIIGPQPPLADLGPAESQNRFIMVFRAFVRVIGRGDCPLAIFLDDMQWADIATLQLMQSILMDPSIRHISFLLAYRDNEVDPSHPFMLTIDKLGREGVPCRQIVLKPLSCGSLTALVGDAMRTEHADPAIIETAGIIAEKTGGNPFFVIQFLRRLYDDGLLRFDFSTGRFSCDPREVVTRGYTDNVIEHMAHRLRLFSAGTQEALKLGACMGNQFGLMDLCAASDLSADRIAADLWPALEAGLVVPVDGAYKLGVIGVATALEENDGGRSTADVPANSQGTVPAGIGEVSQVSYRFQHDRIQQAAYSMLSESERMITHLRLGRALRARTRDIDLEARLFDITDQLNRSLALIDHPDERMDLARLNHCTGRKAKASSAYSAAASYHAITTELLPADAWEHHYDFVLAVHVDLAECHYLSGNFNAAARFFEKAIQHASTALEKAEIYVARARLCQISGNYEGGLDLCIEALECFGIEIPRDHETLQREIEVAYRSVEINMRGRKIHELIDAPLVQDPALKAIISMAAGTLPCSFIGRPEYFPWFQLFAINKTLEHGHVPYAPHIYSCQGFLLPDDPQTVYAFSVLAMELNERFDNRALRGTLLHLHGNHWNYWVQPVATSFQYIERAFMACLETGDLIYSGHIAFEIPWQFIERGDTLAEVIEQSHKYATFARQSNNMPVLETIRMQQGFISCLSGLSRSLACLSDDQFDEDVYLQFVTEAGFMCGVVFFHVIKQIICFHDGRYAESLAASDAALPVLVAATAMPMEANYYFYRALASCALYPKAEAEEQANLRKDIETGMRKLALWSKNCPANFNDRYLLLLAEVARIDGDEMRALSLYEQAARATREAGFLWHEGLANELAARFCNERGLTTSATGFLWDARYAYERWGADGWVARLDSQHPDLRMRAHPRESASTSSSGVVNLDAMSVLKATQAISGELHLTGLVQRLLAIAIENAGADRGILLMIKASEPMAAFDATGKSRALDQVQEVPRSVVSFVQRTGERVLLADASASEAFGIDPYIASQRVRSLLCVPIAHRGVLAGMLYLENRALPNAFTVTRVSMLELIATQTAISLENARLYDELEQRVEERTRELREIQARLVTAAHRAGMAEIASGMLHNVGNVLTSIKTSISILHRDARATRLDILEQATTLLDQHMGNLPTFLATEQGKRLPVLFKSFLRHQSNNIQGILAEVARIEKQVGHIEAVVHIHGMSVDTTSRLVETCLPSELIEYALQVCTESLTHHNIVVQRDYADLKSRPFERHRVLQVLINLISNARDAMMDMPQGRDRVLILRVRHVDGNTIFEVQDSGHGIVPSIQNKIFSFGFTSRKGGHGIGLHSSITNVQAMGGDLSFSSAGEGHGAAFVLTLPSNPHIP